MPNVGVALASIVVVTVAAAAPRHAPVVGLVWQRDSVTGSGTPPVSAEAVITPLAPTLTVATANTPVPVAPGTLTIPPLDSVAASERPVATPELRLMMVAKAVAAVPTCTERLLGRTAATRPPPTHAMA